MSGALGIDSVRNSLRPMQVGRDAVPTCVSTAESGVLLFRNDGTKMRTAIGLSSELQEVSGDGGASNGVRGDE